MKKVLSPTGQANVRKYISQLEALGAWLDELECEGEETGYPPSRFQGAVVNAQSAAGYLYELLEDLESAVI